MYCREGNFVEMMENRENFTFEHSMENSDHQHVRIVQNPSPECYMRARFKQESDKSRRGSKSGKKGKIILTNNESLLSRHMTRVLVVVVALYSDGNIYFIIRVHAG